MSWEHTPEWPGFTPEGYQIYEKATQQIRTALAKGHTYDQACASLHGIAASTRDFISSDYLKIIVAEEHLGSDRSLADLAFALGLPHERLEAVVACLLQEINRAVAQSEPDFPPMISVLSH
ncbi:MAG: hypothetical protein AB1413_02680 [Thermodesulfobacteriota bacterium]|jgi:hypothetical protein